MPQGYLLGNPVTDKYFDDNSKIPFAHRMALITDELYEWDKRVYSGQNLEPNYNLTEPNCISDPNNCTLLLPNKLNGIQGDRRSLGKKFPTLLFPEFECKTFVSLSLVYWANDDSVRNALHIKKWDHDKANNHLGTLAWIKSLNYSIIDDWRPWFVSGQVAGLGDTRLQNISQRNALPCYLDLNEDSDCDDDFIDDSDAGGKWVRGTSTLPKAFNNPSSSKLELIWNNNDQLDGPDTHLSLFAKSMGILMTSSHRFDWTKHWEQQEGSDKLSLWNTLK
ncbi:hypothetical protein IFM89_013709, partial [Coptis chinensis]